MRRRTPFRRSSSASPRGVAFFVGTLLGAATAIAVNEVMKRRTPGVRARLKAHLDGDGPGPMTPATIKDHAADSHMGTPGDNEEERLDEALQESFPTSDPVSIKVG